MCSLHSPTTTAVMPPLNAPCGSWTVESLRSKQWVTECEMALLERSICSHQILSGVNQLVILHLSAGNEEGERAGSPFYDSNLLHRQAKPKWTLRKFEEKRQLLVMMGLCFVAEPIKCGT